MTQPPAEALQRSVQTAGPGSGMDIAEASLVLNLASVADSFTAWGTGTQRRDRELREFWPTEPILASAVYSIVIRNAAFHWTLEGPPASVAATQEMLQRADFGKGWRSFLIKLLTDLLTQDNGAFIEVIRATNSPDAAVVGLAHLDARRCIRSSNPDEPVTYRDRKGVLHKLAWYQVQAISEFPSPIESMYGVQLCAVSRVLRAAQLLKDIGIYMREKIAGDNPNAIYLVGGVASQAISDAMEQHKAKQMERGMVRYIVPLIIASLDPTATVNVESIDLKSLPDGFDMDEAMRWYINQLALGFGADYQDFAPLPGSNLGTSTQSAVLHSKSRGKGPASFMQMMEEVFNFQGILPRNVVFAYDEQDVEADIQQAKLEEEKAQTLERLIKAGVITPDAARQMMLDDGLLTQEVFDTLQEGEDVTPNIVAQDDDPADTDTPGGHTSGTQTAESHRRRRMPKKPRRRKRPPYTAKGDGDYSTKYSQNNSNRKQDEVNPDLPEAFADPERLALEATMENQMARVLATYFRKARGIMGIPKPKVLERVMPWAAKAVPGDILDDAEYWDEFRIAATNVMQPLAERGAKEAVGVNVDIGLSINLDLVNQEVLDFSGRYTTAWWDEIDRSTRKSLRSAITTWQESGLGNQGLPDLTRALEPTFGRARAERIAVTEVTQIFDEGNRLAHNAAGIETEEWQTVEDSKVEEICRPLNGQRFPTNSGPRPVKNTHIGCRCARLPVGSDGQLVGG